MPQRHHARLLAGGAAVLSLALAACGSQLDPETVARANGGTTQGGVAVPGGGGTTTGGGGPIATGGGGSSSTAGGGSTSGGGGSAPEGTGDNAATGGARSASCAGFKNRTRHRLPRRSRSATPPTSPARCLGSSSPRQDAVKAYVAYFNATSSICGRKLQLEDLRLAAPTPPPTSRPTPAAATRCSRWSGRCRPSTPAARAPPRAVVCRTSARAGVTTDRQECTTCFGAQSTVAHEFQNAVPDYVKKNYPDAAQQRRPCSTSTPERLPRTASSRPRRWASGGMQLQLRPGHRHLGVQLRAVRPADEGQGRRVRPDDRRARTSSSGWPDAMQQQGFKPDVFMLRPDGVRPRLRQERRRRGRGHHGRSSNFTPFEEAGGNKELQLYLSWLAAGEARAPSPSFFGLFSWSAARLFVQRAAAPRWQAHSRSSLINSVTGRRQLDRPTTCTRPSTSAHVTPGECWRVPAAAQRPLGPDRRQQVLLLLAVTHG